MIFGFLIGTLKKTLACQVVLGWIGNPGKGRALGVGSVKFTGEVLQNVKLVTYEIEMKKIMSPGGTTVGLANGIVLADGKKIYSADSLKVGLFK